MSGLVNTEVNPPSGNRILCGSTTTTGSAQVLVTIPQGRTWKGHVSATIGAAAVTTVYSATFNTIGSGVIPATGVTLFAISTSELTAASGESSVNGTSGEIYVQAPSNGAVQIQVTATAAAVGFSASAIGILLDKI